MASTASSPARDGDAAGPEDSIGSAAIDPETKPTAFKIQPKSRRRAARLKGNKSVVRSSTKAPENQELSGRGGRASRQKGDRLERAIVRLAQDAGLGAERVPLSGSAGGSYLGDLTIPVAGRDLVIEAKARATGFRELYRWLEHRDALCLKADRSEPLVVLRLSLALEIAALAEKGRVGQ